MFTAVYSQERNVLLDEILRRQGDRAATSSTDLQVLEAQRVRLTLLEEKIKEVLNMLRTLNSMVRHFLTLTLTRRVTHY